MSAIGTNNQSFEREAEIMHTARPAPVRLFETTVNVMDIDRSTFYIWVCGRALSVFKSVQSCQQKHL